MLFFILYSLLSLCISGFPIAVLGPLSETLPLARHCSAFYRMPIIYDDGFVFQYGQFILLAEKQEDMGYYNDIDMKVVNIRDYQHLDQDPNYFISWLKQNGQGM